MFTFFVVITVIGLIGLAISLICLITEQDPVALWITLVFLCGIMFIIGGGCGLSYIDSESTAEHIVQEEQVEENNQQYNYCPYCGKEIK